ncbi:DUF58 domain-containing protein [Candidatus Riflebacteria bacterium]
MELFDSRFISNLKQIHLLMKKKFHGKTIGNRMTRRHGGSAEFADYKEYQPGDDLRFIDWNLFARLEKLYVKLFHNEEALDIYIFLDTSDSLAFDEKKAFYSKQLVGALAFIALQFQDRVKIIPTEQGMERSTSMLSGAPSAKTVFSFLSHIPGSTDSNFEQCVLQFTKHTRRVSLVFVISDFFFNYQETLKRLNFYKHQVHLIQVLTPEEMHPDFLGHYKFQDVETKEGLDLFLEPPLLEQYYEEMDNFLKELESYCRQNKMLYHRVATDFPLTSLLLKMFDIGKLE